GTTGAYWLRDLTARSTAALADVDATSGRRPDPAVTPVRSSGVDPTTPLEPAYYSQLDWKTGTRPAATNTLTLALHNVAGVRVDLPLAGFAAGQHGTLRLTTDGPVTVRIGTTAHRFAAGTHVVGFVA